VESSWRLQQSAELILRTSNGQMPWTQSGRRSTFQRRLLCYIEGSTAGTIFKYTRSHRNTDNYTIPLPLDITALPSQHRMKTTSHSRAVTTDKVQRSLSRHTCSRPSRLLPAWVRRAQRAAATPTVPSCGPCTGHRVSYKTN
jgi:hypothetical protein